MSANEAGRIAWSACANAVKGSLPAS